MTKDVEHLGSTRADEAWTYALLGGGGALLLLAAPLLARWLGDVPFVPFGGVLEWVGGLDEAWWTWLARPAAGLAVGLVAAVVVLHEEYRLEVGPEDVVVVHGDDRRSLQRSAIIGVHRDGRTVTIDGRDGRRLFAEKVEAPRERVREAFTAHGYPYESQ
ncbi:hypothetical protein [uncultured Nocardioides sp.]|uniref:YqeB family protein n=1 Tax=uncultured Nocardioides sp. TaxID=198441 RepID=UPI00262D5F88|nr:hypothetical protein [uncultured Nocardioides sp.]